MTTDVTTVAQAEAYLNAKGIPFTTVTELSGGFANFVFLVTQTDRTQIILKHTSESIKAFPSLRGSPIRGDAEVRALTVLPPLLPHDPSINVHLPVLLHYDHEAHVQHQRPAGSRTLKDAYQDPSLDIPSIGRRLARWLAQLHKIPPPTEFEDNPTAKRIYGGSYRGCVGVLDEAGIDSKPAKVALERYEPLLHTETAMLCHGDFWPGNVLLPDAEEGGGANPGITMVDWEMSRRGNGATDVGQFAAEAWLLDRFRGGRGLLAAFLNEYADSAMEQVTAEFAKRVVVHAGVHLAYWPSMVDWTDANGTKGIQGFGVELMRRAEDEDLEWLHDSVFGPLVKYISV